MRVESIIACRQVKIATDSKLNYVKKKGFRRYDNDNVLINISKKNKKLIKLNRVIVRKIYCTEIISMQ